MAAELDARERARRRWVVRGMTALIFGGGILSALISGLMWHSVLAAILRVAAFGLLLLGGLMLGALVVGGRALGGELWETIRNRSR